MAKNVYFGTADLARKVKKMYLGVAGTAHQVKKGYIGVNGIAHLFYTSSVEALPYRYDMKGSSGPYTTVLGPMDLTTFIRYGSDVSMANGFSDTEHVGASKNFIYAYSASKIIASRDAQTGATIGTFSTAGNVWRNIAGTSEYIGFVNSAYSNDYIVRLFDPPTFTQVKSFGARWRDYTYVQGGYHYTMFIKEHDNDYLYEYDMNGTITRTLHTSRGRYEYFDGDYVNKLKRLDGANGNLLMWKTDSVAVNKRWGVLNYDTMAAITRLTSYPLYKDYSYGAYIHMKP